MRLGHRLPGRGELVLRQRQLGADRIDRAWSLVVRFVSPLPYPISQAGLVVGIWFAIGIIYLAYLLRRHPACIHDMDKVFE